MYFLALSNKVSLGVPVCISLMKVVYSIEIINVTDLYSKEFNAVMEMYKREFPIEEQKSYNQIKTLLLRNIYSLFVVRHKCFEHLIGFAFVMFNSEPAFAFLDYIAIDPMFQRCGFGTLFFNSIVEMQKQNSLGIMLEFEKPELAENEQEKITREKRKQFYLRLGCQVLKGIDYRLPRANGEALPMILVFKPSSSIQVLPSEIVKQLIVTAYDKIHSDVSDRHKVFNRFKSCINDQYFT
ncbi:MAG: GNAT family N-acetyltransferase [Desulfitobacteriaceae bacterium]